MFSYIDRLRKKPVHERNRIAVIGTLVLMGITALWWGTALLARLDISVSNSPSPHDTSSPSGIKSPYDL